MLHHTAKTRLHLAFTNINRHCLIALLIGFFLAPVSLSAGADTLMNSFCLAFTGAGEILALSSMMMILVPSIVFIGYNANTLRTELEGPGIYVLIRERRRTLWACGRITSLILNVGIYFAVILVMFFCSLWILQRSFFATVPPYFASLVLQTSIVSILELVFWVLLSNYLSLYNEINGSTLSVCLFLVGHFTLFIFDKLPPVIRWFHILYHGHMIYFPMDSLAELQDIFAKTPIDGFSIFSSISILLAFILLTSALTLRKIKHFELLKKGG